MNVPEVEIVLEPLAGQTCYAPAAVVGYWLRQTNYLNLVWAKTNWHRKVYAHTPVAKMETLLASIMVGNDAVYRINTTIRPDLTLARAWGQEQFPEQSTVANMLDSLSEADIAMLQQGSAALLQAHSRALRHDFARWLLLDCDATGLLTSKHAEGSGKGFFSGQRNCYGRQLVRISAPVYHETLGSFLFPGNCQPCTVLKLVMGELGKRFPLLPEQRQRTIFRSDAGIGTDANVNWLLWSNYQVVTKGFSYGRARAQARLVSEEAWEADPGRARWIAAAPRPPRFGRRADVYVLCWQTQTGYRYGTLISTVPGLSPLATWSLCDGRGAVEIEIRADKQGLKLPKRRKHKSTAQMALVLLTDIVHNLLAWLHAATLADGPCEDFGTQRMVEDLLAIPGRVEFKGSDLSKVALLETHPYASEMRTALRKLLTMDTIP